MSTSTFIWIAFGLIASFITGGAYAMFICFEFKITSWKQLKEFNSEKEKYD